MPCRLISFIVLFVIFLAFIGFNLENNCNISFGFISFDQVPVYLTAFASFIFGMLCTIPFAISFRFKKKQKAAKVKAGSKIVTDNPQISENVMIDAPQPETKKSRKKDKKNVEAEINQSDYGIN
ncbi:MAG: hypothetical protein LBV20_01735 [Treponema sp.]|jgi:uncharacterized integral membrane protein|nr:hypothetical protein [Treponema sp.]